MTLDLLVNGFRGFNIFPLKLRESQISVIDAQKNSFRGQQMDQLKLTNHLWSFLCVKTHCFSAFICSKDDL